MRGALLVGLGPGGLRAVGSAGGRRVLFTAALAWVRNFFASRFRQPVPREKYNWENCSYIICAGFTAPGRLPALRIFRRCKVAELYRYAKKC